MHDSLHKRLCLPVFLTQEKQELHDSPQSNLLGRWVEDFPRCAECSLHQLQPTGDDLQVARCAGMGRDAPVRFAADMPPLGFGALAVVEDQHVHMQLSEVKSQRASKREREREVAILAQVLHLCLGACDTPLHRGGGWLVD